MPTMNRETVTIDATNQVVGRLATKIAMMLMGKDKPTYTPHIDSGVFVKVVNADKLAFTGNKMEEKKYFRTSNRPGGLKTMTATQMQAKDNGSILKHAVQYMLPKNRTNKVRMQRLIIVN